MSFDDDDDEKEDIFCKHNRRKKKSDRVSEKKKLSALFYPLFVCLSVSTSLFFVHSGFLGIKEKEGTFLYTHTRTEEERLLRELLQREREREREREKEHGEERGNKTLRFVSMQQKRKRKEDFCFTRDDVVERSFFFNLLVPGAPFF